MGNDRDRPMKLLLATDGSECARRALDFLRVLPLSSDSELVILTVVDRELCGNGEESETLDEEYRETLQKINKMLASDAAKLLEQEAGRFGDADLHCATRVAYGQPAEEIVKVAEELDSDLIVTGSHGLGGVKRFLLGSTSDHVMQHASCSVLIVRPDLTGVTGDSVRLEHPLHILIAFDDSRYARHAAEFCASLPMDEKTRVTALSVLPLVKLYRQDISQQLEWIWKEKRKVAEAGLAWVTGSLAWKTRNLASQLREHPDVSEAIIDAADELDIDMIVIGDKGSGSIRRFLLGSVTRRIAQHAPCSVLVVRQKPD
jgi:nucleotide-binding universal stress UspA family protein